MSKTRHDVKRFVMTSKMRQMFRNKVKKKVMVSKGMSKIRHNLKKVCHNIKNMLWHQRVRYKKHVFIIFCSQNNEKLCQKDKNLVKGLETKKYVRMSKSVWCCQKVTLRQNVHHDVNKCNIRHDVKQFVLSKNRHNAINTSWCQSVCHDVKIFIITSNVCHYFKMFDIT